MTTSTSRAIKKILGSTTLALGLAVTMIGTQAANPAQPGDTSLGTSAPAAAAGYGYYRPGYYHYNGRYWAHRRWHQAYVDGYHRHHAGFWIYF